MIKVKLKKIKNNIGDKAIIVEGREFIGIPYKMPEVGESFFLGNTEDGNLHTSTVKAVRENEFDTRNSTYYYEVIK